MKKIVFSFLVLFCLQVACNNSEEETETDLGSDSIEEIAVQDEGEDNYSIVSANETVEEPEQKQALKQDDEKVVYSFKTTKGKTLNIVMQKDEKYMAYRFGTEDQVELQFPEKLENTFDQFSYSYYMRGGGPMNAGLDLNYLGFEGDTHKFVVFDEWSAGEEEDGSGESHDVGIKIIDLKTQKETIIKGVSTSVKGSLIDFRGSGLVKEDIGEM